MTVDIKKPLPVLNTKSYGSADSESTKRDSFFNDEDFKWSEAEEEEVLNIIDKNLMLFVLLMTFVLNMDRTNISNAISDNLASDLGFTNDGINLGISLYHLVFTFCTFPSSAISKKVGHHLWIPILMTSWAVVTWGHALIHNLNGFLTVRFLIAVAEAGFIPACLSYLSLFYKTNELATRLAWFWGAQALASSVSGLIAFGVFRMRGVYGLEGWRWLFIFDGIATHIIGLIAFFYLPQSARHTKNGLRGKDGWLTKRQVRIATIRIIKDDATKKEHHKPINKKDIVQAISDTNLWAHLIITFIGMMSDTPISTYFPSMIKDSGFPTTTSNLLTAPSHIIGLTFSIIIANKSDKHGNVSYFALIGTIWRLAGFILLEYLPDNAGRWTLYSATLLTASFPSWHGMQIAWMSSNMAPMGKRALAMAAVIGAANINSVLGSQIYKASDAPRYRHGNKINISLNVITVFLFLGQRLRYYLINKWRDNQWNKLTDNEKKKYIEEHDQGNQRLDFRYRL